MSETAGHDAIKTAWKLLNLQPDTLLKLGRTQAGPWNVAMAGMAAGGGFVGATMAVVRLFAP